MLYLFYCAKKWILHLSFALKTHLCPIPFDICEFSTGFAMCQRLSFPVMLAVAVMLRRREVTGGLPVSHLLQRLTQYLVTQQRCSLCVPLSANRPAAMLSGLSSGPRNDSVVPSP